MSFEVGFPHHAMKGERISKTKQFFLFIGERILDTTVEMADLFVALTDPQDYRELAAGGGMDGVHARRSQRREFTIASERRRLLKRLEEQRWIVLHRSGHHITLGLTAKGKAIMRKEKIRSADRCPLGQGVLVTFDIPERVRAIRDQFRFFLKECDFQQVQRSVWFTPFDVYDAMREFIRETKSEKWIHVFRICDPFGTNEDTKTSRS